MTEIRFKNKEKNLKLITFKLKDFYNALLIDEQDKEKTEFYENVKILFIDSLIRGLVQDEYEILDIKSID